MRRESSSADDIEFVEPDEVAMAEELEDEADTVEAVPDRTNVEIEIELGFDRTEPVFMTDLPPSSEAKTDVDGAPAFDPGMLAALDIIQAFRHLTRRRNVSRLPRLGSSERTRAPLPPVKRRRT